MDQFVIKKPQKKKQKKPKMTTYQLTQESSILVVENAIDCSEKQFEEFWKKSPTEHWEVLIWGKLTPIPRFQKLYGPEGLSYKFSGTKMPADPDIPDLVERCLGYAHKNYPGKWNGALVNWYPNGSSYIGAHSDDERDLVPGTPILSFSFGAERIFRLKKKVETEGVDKIDFPTKNCSMFAMCGSTQKEYTHEITKTKKPIGPRINVTIRCFR